MAKWFNPRVLAVAISIAVLVVVSKVGEPGPTIRRDIIACALMIVLYFLAFLVPLWRTLGFRRVLGPLGSLLMAWTAVGFALVADALPITLEEKLRRTVNIPMVLGCLAGAAAFFLFFDSTARALRKRDDVLEARRGH